MTAANEDQLRVGPTTGGPYGLYLRVMRRIGHYGWFSLFMKHVGSRVDRVLIRASRGRFSMSGPQLPTMLLTTRGRRSGKDRTVPLHYVRDGKNLVAACENFGLEAASSWPKNLLADPKARIEIGGTAATYLSRPATDDEVARNMPRLVEMWPAHDSHMERNGVRQVIIFEPSGHGRDHQGRRAPVTMTTRDESPSTATDDLPQVDPPARVSRRVRAYAAFLRTGVGRWLAKNIAPKVDPWLLGATGGRLAMGLMLPSALLTTTGAKTGQPRTNPVFYFHDGPDVIVIASNYGADRHPAWYHNLSANPRAQIATNGGGPVLTASAVSDAAERKRIWAMADRVYPLWPDYRRRAARCHRTIPIIRLRADA